MSDKFALVMALLAQARDGMEGRDWIKHAVSTVIASVVAAAAATYVMTIRNDEQIKALTRTQDAFIRSVDNRFDRLDGKVDELRREVYNSEKHK